MQCNMWFCRRCCGCCGHGSSESLTSEPSERSRLLPPTDQPPPTEAPSTAVDTYTRASAPFVPAAAVDAGAVFAEQLLQRMTTSVIDVAAAASAQHLDPAEVAARQADYAAQLRQLHVPAHLLRPPSPSSNDHDHHDDDDEDNDNGDNNDDGNEEEVNEQAGGDDDKPTAGGVVAVDDLQIRVNRPLVVTLTSSTEPPSPAATTSSTSVFRQRQQQQGTEAEEHGREDGRPASPALPPSSSDTQQAQDVPQVNTSSTQS